MQKALLMYSRPQPLKPSFFAIAIYTLLITGCDSIVSNIISGQFVDSPVEGLEYQTASLSGKTNQYGQFQYLPGETVVFYIGNIRFPVVQAGNEITPLSVFSVNNLDDVGVVNMLRLLQTLDQDGNPNNGISISTQAIDASAGLDVNFTAPNFDAQVASLVANSGSPYTTLISKEDAVQHFRTALPYRTSDIVGAWAFMALQTPEKGTLNSDDFALNFDQAIVGSDSVISLSPLVNNPSTQTPNFTIMSKISDLSLVDEGSVRGQIIEQGELFDFAYLGSSKDMVIGYQSALTHQEISFSIKVSLDYTLRDLEGNWQRFLLQTPNNGNSDPTQYGYLVEDHIINDLGSASRQIIASSDDNVATSYDVYSFAFSDIDNMPILLANGNNYAMNAAKTVMINPIFNQQNNQFSVMLKQAAHYAQQDLIGTWYGITIATPQQNQIHSQLFDTDITRFIIDEQGDASITDILLSHALEVKNFNLSINSQGQISTSPSIDGTNYWAMDASKTILVLLTLNPNNSQSLTIFIKQSGV